MLAVFPEVAVWPATQSLPVPCRLLQLLPHPPVPESCLPVSCCLPSSCASCPWHPSTAANKCVVVCVVCVCLSCGLSHGTGSCMAGPGPHLSQKHDPAHDLLCAVHCLQHGHLPVNATPRCCYTFPAAARHTPNPPRPTPPSTHTHTSTNQKPLNVTCATLQQELQQHHKCTPVTPDLQQQGPCNTHN